MDKNEPANLKAWATLQTNLLNTAKFLASGTKIIVKPNVPKEVMVDGKFGKRKMYIVDTIDYGLVYVSISQFLRICDAFHGDFSSAITVEL